MDAHLAPTHLLVRAGDLCCALPLAAVRRVVRALPIHPLPGAASALLGLAEFAGEPLPVLDLARLVEAAPSGHPAFPVTIVARTTAGAEPELVGLAADEALELVNVEPSAVRAGAEGFLAGEAQVHGTAVRLLEPRALGATR